MRAVRILAPCSLLVLLLATAAVPGAEPAAPQLRPLAHSALVTLEGTSSADALLLRVRANGAAAPPPGVSDFSVSLNGKPLEATAQADGSYRVAVPGGAGASGGRLDVTVTHDGIREVLTVSMGLLGGSAADPGDAGGGGFGVHSQILWWVLNIAIVLIAALAISRRRGS